MNRCSLAIGCLLPCVALAQTTLYALTNPIAPSLFTLDASSGAVLTSVPVSGHEALFGGLGGASGTLYSIDGFNDGNSDRLFKIDPATGNGGVVGDTGENWNFRCVEVHPTTGQIYAIRDNALYTLDASTGAATLISTLSAPTLDQLTSLAIAPDGTGYATDIGNTGLFKISLASGAMAHIGDIGTTGNWYNDMAFDPSGNLYAARLQGGVYTVDIASAQESFKFNGSYVGLAFLSDGCYPDCDGSGTLNIFDYICFGNAYAAQQSYADCDGSGTFNIFDYICFGNAYAAGCP